MQARFLAGAIIALTATHASAARVTALFKSGDLDPAGSGISTFVSPAATSRRNLAFQGLTGAIMTKTGSTFAVIVRTGDPLPSPLVGTFNAFFDPRINDGGQIVFRASVNSTMLPNDQFVFFYDGSTIVPVTTGIEVRTPPDLNNGGDVVYVDRTGTLYLWNGVGSVPIAGFGTAVPGGGTIRDVGDNPVVNDGGVIAFEAEVDGAGDGLFTWDTLNGIVTVAQDGLASPVGGTYADFPPDQLLAIDAGGRVVFRAEFDLAPDSAILRYDPVGPATGVIAKEGDLVGASALTDFDEEYVGTNGAGDVAFEGRFGSSRALVLASGGSLTTLVSNVGTPPQEFAARLTSTNRIVWARSSGIQQYDGAVTTIMSIADTTPLGTGFRGRQPSINNLDVVAFRTTRTAMYRLKRGTLDVLAVTGGPSPGTGTITFPLEPAYRRRLVVSVSDVAGGVLAEATSSGLVKVVAENDAAPIGGTFALDGPLSNFVNAFDVKGRTLDFIADVLGGPVSGGLFRTKLGSGAFAARVQVGDTAPNGALFTAFTNVRTTGSRSVFTASLDDGNTGIFVADPPRPMTQIALMGDPVPGGVGTFETFGTVRVARRRVLFAARVNGLVSTGYFLWDNGTLVKVVADEDVTPVGGTFSLNTDVASAAIALSGSRVAFAGNVDGGGADSGIFLFRNGALTPIVLSGYATPLGGAFQTFDSQPIMLFGRTVVFTSVLDFAGAASGLFSLTP